MAGLLKDWLGQNPFYQGMDERRSALGQFGLGLMNGTDLQDGLAKGVAGAMDGRKQDTAYASEQKKEADRIKGINATATWLQTEAGGDPFAASMSGLVEAGAITPNDALSQIWKMRETGSSDWSRLNDNSLYNKSTGETIDVGGAGGASSTEYGLTPIWGKLPDGTFGYGVQGKDGSFKPVDTGDLNPLDPRTLAGERSFGTAIGTSQGAGAASAQGDITTATQALGILDQIETSSELPFATGASAGLGGNKIPGTGRYGFQTLVDQAKSGAFLSAIQQMRGMGALSNAEGQVATSAITRMDTATSEADFRKALADYRKVIEAGMERAQGRVGMQPNVNVPGMQPPAATSAPVDPLGIR